MTDPIRMLTTAEHRVLTPAEHRALAEIDLARMRGIGAGSAAYSSLAQSAIAHTLAAVASYLDPDQVTAPEVRLPGFRTVRARQSEAGDRKWGFVISSRGDEPDVVSPRYMWATLETALAAGIAAALTGAAACNGLAPVPDGGVA
jgi:hypothetical protein